MGLTWFDNLFNPRKLRQGREGGGRGLGERCVVGWVNGWMKRIGRVCGETDECCLREYSNLSRPKQKRYGELQSRRGG